MWLNSLEFSCCFETCERALPERIPCEGFPPQVSLSELPQPAPPATGKQAPKHQQSGIEEAAMKRQLSTPDTASLCGSQEQLFAPQKRCRTTENTPRRCTSPGQAPRTPESSRVHNDHRQQHTAGTAEAAQDYRKQYLCPARVRYIREWVCDVAHSDSMSDLTSQTRRRAHKVTVRTRSASPTKKSPEYRQNGMARAHVYVDHMFDLPTDVDELRCHIIGDAYDNASELKGIPTELRKQVGEIANEYCYHCRELAREAKGEAEWKSALLEGVFRRLVKLLSQNMLATSASDKPWRTELKPRPPSLRDLLSSVTPRLGPAVDLSATPFANFDLTNQPYSIEPSETATVISETTAVSTVEDHDPSNALTTPKPDILLGLARHSFTEVHQVLLGEWQDNGQLLSEPQLVQQGLHFPFLLVEAKGLATSGNIMGAENQAAVGGACAINILKALQRLEPSFPLVHVVFSISTEGPLHQLFIHYHIDGKYQMTVHRAWRVTLQRDCTEFVLALARIIQWGGSEYRNAVVASLVRIVDGLQV
jgi:hypothetical protein